MTTRLHPPAVLLGARSVGETVEESLALYALTDQSFTVEKVNCTGEGLALAKASGEEAKDSLFLVKQQITRTGAQEGRIVFLLRTSAGKEVELVVPLSYLGIASQ